MQKYDEMVDTGVDWLGKVPKQWPILSTSKLFSFAKGSEAQKLTNEYLGDNPGEYPVYSGQTSNGGVIGLYKEYEFDEPQGVILVTTVGAKAMTARFIKGKFSLSQNCLIMRSRDTDGLINPRYYSYTVQPLFKKERALIPDHMQPSMRMSDLSAYRLPQPEIEIQQKIADFLDAETAKIDNLIARQERLLQLLEEKRRATITHAVTRGLNPRCELKETNVPWLGKIPAHWDVVRISRLFAENKDSNKNLDSLEPMKYKFGTVVSKDTKVDEETQDELRRYNLIQPDDIMINGLNLNYDFITQRVAIVKKYGCMTPAYISIRKRRDGINTAYYTYLLKALDSQKVLNGWGTGIRLTLNYSELKKKELAYPPIDEQFKIVEFLNTYINKTNVLEDKIQAQITLLRERRTSLISHAVTGKIKV